MYTVYRKLIIAISVKVQHWKFYAIYFLSYIKKELGFISISVSMMHINEEIYVCGRVVIEHFLSIIKLFFC